MNTSLKTILGVFFFLILAFTITLVSFANPTNDDPSVSYLKDIPAKDVNCIFNDSKGFMWIGTLDGLHRYDGYSYKSYRIEPTQNSIPSNMIISIDEDSKGNIWIGTYGKGVCMLNTKDDTFTSFDTKTPDEQAMPTDVITIMVDDQDYLWTVNWFGIYRAKIDSAQNTLAKVEKVLTNSVGSSDTFSFKTIFQDKTGTIWVGTNGFTIRLVNPYDSPETLKTETYNCYSESICDFENGVLVGGNAINSIVKTKSGDGYEVGFISNESTIKVIYLDKKIWAGQRTGISCLEKNKNGVWETILRLQKDFSEQSLSSNITTSLVSDQMGQIWQGTRGGGVNIISPIPKRFQHYKHSTHPGSLANDLVMCVFEDSYQNLWVGTEERGASVLRKGSSYQTGFTHLVANAFENENRVYAIEETKTPASRDHKSIIWTGTSHPKYLAAFNPQTLREIPLPAYTSRIKHIFAIENQNDSILWLGSYSGGLWRFDLDAEGKIRRMRNFTPSTPSKLTSRIVRSIFKDSNGNVWVGTDKGITMIPKDEAVKENPNFKTFTLGEGPNRLSHDYILQIFESSTGVLWIGTMGGGLIKCVSNKGTYEFTAITTREGLPNNTVKSIVEDEDGYLWLSSNNGISRYNPNDGSIVNFDLEDGLQDMDFSEICGIKRKNGDIIFGGINGFNVFQSRQMPTDKTKPLMYFTDFQILNKEVRCGDLVDGKKVLTKTIEYTKSIELDYKHNSFAVGFVGIQYNSPGKNHYRYKLEGFDKEWYRASPDYRMAKYTNIPDGDYIFKVMASNSDNIWTDLPIELNIRIHPPLHRSKPAMVAYAIILLLAAYITFRINRIIQKRKRDVLISQMEKEQVEEISKLRLQFFTNISHEFRTPLSLITTPLEQLATESKHAFTVSQQKHLNLIKQNVRVMTRLIDQLLDFRKLDQNKIRIRPSKQSLNVFLENIYPAFMVLANQKNIAYTFTPLEGENTVWIDIDKMEKVIYNLLSNAFKYTPENGNIRLKAEFLADENQYQISVSDTGLGIDDTEKEHIFERYYMADNKAKQNISGTGIGLALSKGFVDLHEGQIGFRDNAPTGTVFFVKLLVGHAHFSDKLLTEQSIKPAPATQTEDLQSVEGEQKEQMSSNLPKLLIVEDNYDLRKQIKNLFRSEFRVVEAEDGQVGLQVCRDQLPEVIITDLMMPNMDGLEMCQLIKSDENTSHIPILILTAKNTDDTQVEGYNLGADSYLSKPFSTEVLKASVLSLIKNREQLKKRFQKEIEINPDIISNTPADAKFLDKILALIKNNMSESDYSVEQLASDYGVSRIYLNRKLKALTGETTIEFIRNIKLKYAAELLKQNKLTISEVAWEIGYNDIRTFRKRFKEKFEITPSEFAKQYSTDQN